MEVKITAPALLATNIVAAAAGYILAPKQPVAREVRESGFFRTTTSEVLSTTVESLHEENQLLVFQYKGAARVASATTALWLFGGRQELIVPATVSYYLDLSRLSIRDVAYDERAGLVTVTLPKLDLGDVAFQPEGATTLNSGTLTFSEAQVEALRKFNYASARRAMTAQAQQPGLVRVAREQAARDVEAYFRIPLRLAGMKGVEVSAVFR